METFLKYLLLLLLAPASISPSDHMPPDSPTTFQFEHAAFTMKVPAALDLYDKKKEEMENLRKMSPQLVEQMEAAMKGQPTKEYRLESRTLPVSLVFAEGPRSLVTTSPPCTNADKPDAPIEVKGEWWQLGSLRVCAVYTWEYEVEGPNQVKDDISGVVKLNFQLEKASYRLEIGVRNLDRHDVKGLVMEMARSLRLKGEGAANEEEGKKGCKLVTDKRSTPQGSIGLLSTGEFQVRRDGFIPLHARAEDSDEIAFTCSAEPNCSGGSETSHLALHSGTRLKWTITTPGARTSFVEIGCLPNGLRSTTGDNVLLMPPSDLKVGESERLAIQVSPISTSPLNPPDNMNPITVSVTVTRSRSVAEVYEVLVEGPQFVPPAKAKSGVETAGGCQAKMDYQPGSDLKAEILLPQVKQNSALIPGERIILRAKPVEDKDKFTVECRHPDCKTDGRHEFEVHDAVEYHWEVAFGEGHFEVEGKPSQTATGDVVIFRAPSLPTQARTERITMVAKNKAGKLKDPDSAPAEVKLEIFRAKVVVGDLPANFLPEFNHAPHHLKVYLSVYHPSRTGVEVPAFDHLSTLVNYQLAKVSNWTGVCTNFELADDSQSGPEGKKPDLFFDANGMRADYLCYEKSPLDGLRAMYAESLRLLRGRDTVRLPISIRDYAAYGELSLATVNEASFERGFRAPFQIPIDRDHDGIADASQVHENYNHEWDAEQRSGIIAPSKAGDGFTTFEEYRGFRRCRMHSCVSPDHIRTDPGRVDLFVHSKVLLTLDRFERASGMDVHFIGEDMFSKDKVVNHISKVGEEGKQGDQCGVWIESGIIPKPSSDPYTGATYNYQRPQHNTQGLTMLRPNNFEGVPHIPSQVDKIILNMRKIRADGIDEEEVAAHELGHACFLQHHGSEEEFDAENFGPWRCVRDPAVHSEGQCDDLLSMRGGTKYSGDMRCIMRYDAKAIVEAQGHYVIRCAPPCNSNAVTTDTLRGFRVVWDVSEGWRQGQEGSQVLLRDQFCSNPGANSPHGACAPGRGSCYLRLKVKCW